MLKNEALSDYSPEAYAEALTSYLKDNNLIMYSPVQPLWEDLSQELPLVLRRTLSDAVDFKFEGDKVCRNKTIVCR